MIQMNMSTSMPIRILLLVVQGALLQICCVAFSPNTASNIRINRWHCPITRIRASQHQPSHDAESESVLMQQKRSNVLSISKPEEYVKFLERDGLCVIKFYASWCKSCAKFGIKYNKLAHEYKDHVHFAEVEYNANKVLCKTLKVRSLPTVHIYKKGEGKVVEMTKRPSEFQDVVDEIDRLLIADDRKFVEDETYTITMLNATDDLNFEQRMAEGNDLSKEVMKKITLQEQVNRAKRAMNEKRWFTFPFSF